MGKSWAASGVLAGDGGDDTVRLPEVHIWRGTYGQVSRVEFHDGPQRMEIRTNRLVQTAEPGELPRVQLTVFAKPIYHDEEPKTKEDDVTLDEQLADLG